MGGIFEGLLLWGSVRVYHILQNSHVHGLSSGVYVYPDSQSSSTVFHLFLVPALPLFSIHPFVSSQSRPHPFKLFLSFFYIFLIIAQPFLSFLAMLHPFFILLEPLDSPPTLPLRLIFSRSLLTLSSNPFYGQNPKMQKVAQVRQVIYLSQDVVRARLLMPSSQFYCDKGVF